MVCPCLAVPLLIGGAVGSTYKTDLTVLTLCLSLIVVIVLVFRSESSAPCDACNAFGHE